MSPLTRTCSLLLRSAARLQVPPRARISAKPPKNALGVGEQVFVMVTMFVTILGPSGWILSHLENYKKR